MMKTALEQIKYDLKEHADFGKVSIIDALSAIDAAAQHYYRQGGLDATKMIIDSGNPFPHLIAKELTTHYTNPNLEIPK